MLQMRSPTFGVMLPKIPFPNGSGGLFESRKKFTQAFTQLSATQGPTNTTFPSDNNVRQVLGRQKKKL